MQAVRLLNAIRRAIAEVTNVNGLFPRQVFGNKPRATSDDYLSLWASGKQSKPDFVSLFETGQGFEVDSAWLDELALQTQVVVKKSAPNWMHGRILYSLLCSFAQEQENGSHMNVLETGTARGFSALCLAKALNDVGACGQVISIDVLPHNVKMYWNCIADADGPTTRESLLANWPDERNRVLFVQGWSATQIAHLGISRIHFAFLDGEHTEKAVMKEFNWISERQEAGDIIVFDDVSHSEPGVFRAVKSIETDPRYQVQILGDTIGRSYAIARRTV